jgi:hypothetical protein
MDGYKMEVTMAEHKLTAAEAIENFKKAFGGKPDNIKHPSHYTEGRKYEPKDVIRDWGLNFNLGSAVKYISRAGRKDDIVQDLKKAQQFIQFEIDALEEECPIDNIERARFVEYGEPEKRYGSDVY